MVSFDSALAKKTGHPVIMLSGCDSEGSFMSVVRRVLFIESREGEVFFFQMSEGRRTQVVLLDERRLDIVVQPRLQTLELLSIVASHCSLKEPDKAYFGLAYVDEKCVKYGIFN